jgi:integrase
MKHKYERGPKLFKRSNGYYYAYVPRRGKVSLGVRTYAEAEQEYKRLLGGQEPTAQSLFFDSVAQEYLNRGTAGLADSTMKRYKWCLEKHLIPHFRLRDIRKIRPSDVSDYIELRRKQPSSAPNTILKEIFALSTVLSWCVQKGWLTVNPIREVKKPSRKEVIRPNYTPTEGEISKVLKHLHKSVVTFFLALCNTGCRVNELRMANVSDFNYDNGTLRVIRKGGKEEIVFLNDLIRNRIADDLLSRANKRDVKPSEPLFLNRYKTRLLSIKRSIAAACRRANVPHLTHHSLRHGYATILYEQGYEIPVVANLLGNSIQVCTDIYIKWRNRKHRELAKQVQIGRLDSN